MQMSKCLSLICASALLAGAVSIRAETEAQAKAREALRQKMQELDSQQPPASAPAASKKQPASRPAPAPAPAPPPPPPPPPAAVVAPAPAAAAPTVTLTPPVVAAPVLPAEPLQSDTDAVAKARAALRAKMLELDAQQAAAASTIPGGTTASQAAAAAPGQPIFSAPPGSPDSTGVGALAPPPSPIPATKEMRLADLLRKYKADEITPEQYHTQRAAILAEP